MVAFSIATGDKNIDQVLFFVLLNSAHDEEAWLIT